jgi:hypothetical protein
MSLQYKTLSNTTADQSQRLRIIDALEVEIKHFTKAMEAIQKLPSSHDEEMTEAYTAYCKIISAYQEMINVRMGIIQRLKSNTHT